MKTRKNNFLSSKFENLLNTFFLRPPRSTISPPVEPTRTMTLLHRHSNHLNKSLAILKITCENAQEQLLRSKFDNVLSTFFSDHLDQHLALHENLLGLWHSYTEPQIDWTSPWLYWESLFMKTHKNNFELQIRQPIKFFFLRPPRSKLTL